MGISYFTYITGIASLLGLILQVFNIFPKYKKIRNSSFLIILGIFFGSFLRAFDASRIAFKIEINTFILFLIVFALTIICLLIGASLTKNPQKRVELFNVLGIAFFSFMLVLSFGSIIMMAEESPRSEISRLTVPEFITLAKEAEQKGDYERAIMHLEYVKSRLDSDDPRIERIEEKIKEAKLKQLE